MPSLTRSWAMKRKKGDQVSRKKKEVKRRRRATPRAQEGEEEDDDFFGGEEHVASSSEEEGVGVNKNRSHREVDGEQSKDDVEAAEETAEEKRLRIAKAYLDRLKASVAADDDESGGEGGGDEDEDGEERGGDGDEDDGEAVAAKLKEETAEASGRMLRKIAARVRLGASVGSGAGEQEIVGKRVGKRHRLSVTAVGLTSDDRLGFSASKDGAIYQWDVETNKCAELPPPDRAKDTRKQSRHLLSIAVSSDGRYLAAGGLDRRVHVWDVRTFTYLKAFAGHRGAVTCVNFRIGANQLFSAGNDRAVKIWNVDDMAYVDSLFGHQSDVIGLDCLRQEKILTSGRDKTCRIWKVPEETQLVFRAQQSATSIDCCAFISAGEFVSGSDDGSVALWSLLRKKPVFVVRNAHGGVSQSGVAAPQSGSEGKPQRNLQRGNGVGRSDPGGDVAAAAAAAVGRGGGVGSDDAKMMMVSGGEEIGDGRGGGGADTGAPDVVVAQNGHSNGKESIPVGVANQPLALGSVGELGFSRVGVESWVGAIAACRGSDLFASGAGDGVVRIWGHDSEKQQLWTVGMLPAVGFVNSLAFGRSGRFLLAGMGQEPRLGRWGKNKQARNQVVMYKIDLES